MRTISIFINTCFLLLFAFSALAEQRPAWTVVSSGKLDSRVQHELEKLASRSHAQLRISRGVHQAADNAKQHGNLSIEIEDNVSAGVFLAELKKNASTSTVEPTPDLAREGYILRVFYGGNGAPDQINIRASSIAGLHHALLRIADLLAQKALETLTDLIPRPQALHLQSDGKEAILADYPSVPIRGVVEGFYGHPWSYQQRVDMLRFEGQHRLNTYYYGPKADPYHRSRWRDPYPPAEIRNLAQLAAVARENFVDFSFALSPGLSMKYSSREEFDTLAKKFESISKLGVSHFALFLDDIPQALIYPEDKTRFKTLSQAHVYVANKLYNYLKTLSLEYVLTLCPTTYTNEWGDRDYIADLGAGLNPDITIQWTGNGVDSRIITETQAKDWGEYLHRKPLVWDNFPGNDGGTWELNLDPVQGRDGGLHSAISGLFSNPMYEAHASFIPLQTVADYLWNSPAYEPERSHTHALIDQFGESGPQMLAPLSALYGGNSRRSTGDETNEEQPKRGNLFGAIFHERREPIDIPKVKAQIDSLDNTIQTLGQQEQTQQLASELLFIPDQLRAQVNRLMDDPAFEHLPDGRIQWNRDLDALKADRLDAKPNLDGDFSKWQPGSLYVLNDSAHLVNGENLWKGPGQFSARAVLRWDKQNLYLGVDVTDPQLYQPFSGRGIQNGDAIHLIFDSTPFATTAQGKSITSYDLYLSPGNFADVEPSIYCEEDFFPPRERPHDYSREIKTAWRKTPIGYSADIAIPVSFFDRSAFLEGQDIALSFGVQKSFQLADSADEDLNQIVFTSKRDKLFPADPESPVTLQRLLFCDASMNP